jgi:hypothetical protein
VPATAILDQLVHHCDLSSIDRPSYRLEKPRVDLVE